MSKNERKGYYISDQHACYFLTFTVVGWVDLFTRNELKKVIIDSFKFCQEKKGLIINAYVIMSNHIHLIARAKEDSEGLSAIIRDFKKYTSKLLLNYVLNNKKESRSDWMKIVFSYHAKYNKNNSNYQLWQQDNRPKILLHPKFISQKIQYIHLNPVRSGIVENAEDYLFSSARNYLNFEYIILEVDVIDFGVTEGYIAM
jgi:REP element-mobilizing transposase RayT